MTSKVFTLLFATALIAAVPARAADTAATEPPCNDPRPDDADLRLGHVTGASRVAFLSEGPNCPGPAAACRSKFFAAPGEAVLLGASRPGYVCATGAGTGGWLPQDRVAAQPIDPAPPLAAWAGTWRLYDNEVVLTPAGDGIKAGGEAYWPAKNVMPANEGAFDGTAKPSGNRLHLQDDSGACTVELALAEPFLVVADNRECGGHNVSFTGIYTRRSGTR
ncbi:MAG: hypothetical protein JO213_21410 [Alphaproteobacteria bacterium]|nr:hypothetical protein [Alphaproteobacteria bacterium]